MALDGNIDVLVRGAAGRGSHVKARDLSSIGIRGGVRRAVVSVHNEGVTIRGLHIQGSDDGVLTSRARVRGRPGPAAGPWHGLSGQATGARALTFDHGDSEGARSMQRS